MKEDCQRSPHCMERKIDLYIPIEAAWGRGYEISSDA